MNKEPEMNNSDLTEVTPPTETTDENIEATDEALESTNETAEAQEIPSEAQEIPSEAQEIPSEAQEIPSKAQEKPHEDEKNNKKSAYDTLKSLFDYVEVLAIAILAVLLVFTFCFRLCKVDGNSMNKTLANNELLITTNLFYEPQQGDIIVFHLSNDYYQQPLVKRVIATEGQRVEIDFVSGTVKVDGVVLEEEYIYLDGGKYDLRAEFSNEHLVKNEDGRVIGFDATVPNGHVFAMGDNRNHSTDSRAVSVGFVDKNCILGKALVRVAPFTVFN